MTNSQLLVFVEAVNWNTLSTCTLYVNRNNATCIQTFFDSNGNYGALVQGRLYDNNNNNSNGNFAMTMTMTMISIMSREVFLRELWFFPLLTKTDI